MRSIKGSHEDHKFVTRSLVLVLVSTMSEMNLMPIDSTKDLDNIIATNTAMMYITHLICFVSRSADPKDTQMMVPVLRAFLQLNLT